MGPNATATKLEKITIKKARGRPDSALQKRLAQVIKKICLVLCMQTLLAP